MSTTKIEARAINALRRLVTAARTAEIEHSAVYTVDDGAIAEALDVLSLHKKAAGRLLDGREWSQMPEVKRG